ncbi:dihydroxyacetone kinase subunit DhaK [Streptosporangium sp. NPDC020145]|uniref:dihydroxyacetone kinase subunit DhaK n=1 Tax=Streptosporangium sp. NPDC020145 TaxID=3154694 RepID=UPI003417707D
MKKLINSAETVVTDALRGLAAAHPDLRVDPGGRIVSRACGPTPGKVGLVSGGGSGHEPLHAGFVGYGMLDAACPGEIFTSLVPDQMVTATAAANGGVGVLHVVKNYTGDVLNFELAADLCAEEGVEIARVLVDDDVAVRDSPDTAGRRGTGATVFVEKIAGAAAEGGAPLAEVARVAREVNARSRSFGIALEACTTPVSGRPTFELGETEIELGVGIHGEPGRSRAAMRDARELAAVALDAVNEDMPLSGDVLVMVNGLGGTPLIELHIVFAEIAERLSGRGARVARSLVGDYVTSLDMRGFSVTACLLSEDLARLWDAPVQTPALRWGR